MNKTPSSQFPNSALQCPKMAGGTGLGILGWCLWSLGLPLVALSCLLQSESRRGTEEKLDLPAPFSYQRRKLLLRSFSANLA